MTPAPPVQSEDSTPQPHLNQENDSSGSQRLKKACAKAQCTIATPAPRRRSRRPNYALKERLARCEQVLDRCLGKDQFNAPKSPIAPASRQSQGLSDSSSTPTPRRTPTDGKLVEEEDGKLAFMDHDLLELVHDEKLKALRKLVHTEGRDDRLLNGDTSDDHYDLVLGDSPQISIESLWPNQALLVRLWQIFLDRVDPLIKMIHVPSFQEFVVQATTGPQHLSENMTSLMLSIFLMAVVSLSEDECESIFEESKASITNRFSLAVRQTLRRLKLLEGADLVVLQALILYVISLQGRCNRHAAWVLNGLIIRIAQKMGLHRDGKVLGLTPFETEMRRRVWWQIIAIDAKFAVVSGMGHSLMQRDWNVEEPRNLNDADIFPADTHQLSDRDGPTEMIFCLVQCKITKFLVDTPGLEPVKMMKELDGLKNEKQQPNAPRSQQIDYYREQFDILEKNLWELLETRCNPSAGQIHMISWAVVTTLVNQKRELINGLGIQPGPGVNASGGGEVVFKASIAIMEHATSLYTSTESTSFHWYILLNIQLDVFLYMVAQLGHRIEGEGVERAWSQVEIIYRFHYALYDLTDKTSWRLAHFVLRAWAKRQSVLTDLGRLTPAPPYIHKLERNFQDTSDFEAISHSQNNPTCLINNQGPAPEINTTNDESRDTDWLFLETMATAQDHLAGPIFLGYGIGPWMEW